MTAAVNKALIKTIFEARSRRDPAPFIAAMADDFIWRITGSTAWSGEYVGKAEVRERLFKPLFAQFTAPTNITPTRILADGDYVVAECKGEYTRGMTVVEWRVPRRAQANAEVASVADEPRVREVVLGALARAVRP